MSDDPRHEITEWKSRPVLVGLGCFVVFMIVLYVVMGALAKDWSHGFWPQRRALAVPESIAGWNDVAPQLQTDAAHDLAEVKKTEQLHLHATKWSDAARGYATIPIDRAMDLYAQSSANHQTVLPPVVPATPIDLQDQKSATLAPAASTNAAPATP